MEQYVIKGGIPLKGTIDISGAKNAALPIIASSILTDETVVLENLPDVSDINVMLDAIKKLGANVVKKDRHTVKINAGNIFSVSVDYESMRKIRASYYLLGALLGKYNEAEVPLPGGCNIGSRPIDLHIKGFQAMGTETDIQKGNIIAKAKYLHGAEIFLDMTSVGATINIMMAAVLANGKTVIENAAKEPHVVDTANFLNSMGAQIRGAGTDVIRIRGVSKLHGCTYNIVPDMIEAGTYMLAAVATKGDITVNNVIPKHIEAISAKICEMGCKVYEGDDFIRVVAENQIRKTNIKTLPYPGFPTDMQPQISAILATANGTSFITESIFENRFKYISELVRMGAEIKLSKDTAIISGVERLSGAQVSSPDLRAGAALALAGLSAEGITLIDDVQYIKRGYEDFDKKLQSDGAKIELANSNRDVQIFKLMAL